MREVQKTLTIWMPPGGDKIPCIENNNVLLAGRGGGGGAQIFHTILFWRLCVFQVTQSRFCTPLWVDIMIIDVLPKYGTLSMLQVLQHTLSLP